MADLADRNELSEAEIAERMARAVQKMLTTPPQPRGAPKRPATTRQKPKDEPKKSKKGC